MYPLEFNPPYSHSLTPCVQGWGEVGLQVGGGVKYLTLPFSIIEYNLYTLTCAPGDRLTFVSNLLVGLSRHVSSPHSHSYLSHSLAS